MASFGQASYRARRLATVPRYAVDFDSDDESTSEAGTAPRLTAQVRPAVVELEKVTKIFSTGGATGVAAVTDLSLTLPDNSATLITGPVARPAWSL